MFVHFGREIEPILGTQRDKRRVGLKVVAPNAETKSGMGLLRR